MTHKDPSFRHRISQFINSRAGRGLSLDHICEQFPEISRKQIQNALSYLIASDAIFRNGPRSKKALYSSLKPNGSLGTSDCNVKTVASTPALIKRASVEWPSDVKIQDCTSPHIAPGLWTGTDWSQAMIRPGCRDHLQHPSRRGDRRVMHGTPKA